MTSSSILRARSKFCLLMGNKLACPQSLEEFELDLVNERSALKRIELVDRLRNLPWCKPVNGLKEKLVRTGSIILERGRRVAAHTECVFRNCSSEMPPMV